MRCPTRAGWQRRDDFPRGHGMSCWPPSTSYVAPVTAVFVIRWTAIAATSTGPTTRPIGRVARSSARRLVELVSQDPRRQRRVDEPGRDHVRPDRSQLDGGVRSDGGQRGGKRWRRAQPTPGRRASVPVIKVSEPPARTRCAHARAIRSEPSRCSSMHAQRLVEVEVGDRHVDRTSAGDRTWSICSPVGRRRTARRRSGHRGRASLRSRPDLVPAAFSSRSRSRPVRMTRAPAVRAWRAVSRPMPELPPITDHDLAGKDADLCVWALPLWSRALLTLRTILATGTASKPGVGSS